MYLSIDIGNTRIKVTALDKSGRIRSTASGNTARVVYQAMEAYHPEGIAYCVTGHLPRGLGQRLREYGALEVTHQIKLPFASEYRTPATLGRDRIAALAGAVALYPQKHLLVVDAGTCMTADVLTADKIYRGGNISPGLMMRLQAMHTFTDKLPLVSLSLPADYVGRSTETALQNGALRGALAEISSLRAKLKRRYGPVVTLLTGGHADFLQRHLRYKTIVVPELVARGLYELYRLNRQTNAGSRAGKQNT